MEKFCFKVFWAKRAALNEVYRICEKSMCGTFVIVLHRVMAAWRLLSFTEIEAWYVPNFLYKVTGSYRLEIASNNYIFWKKDFFGPDPSLFVLN